MNNASKYYRWYNNICSRAKCRTLPNDVYSEKHHVLPKSLYPHLANDINNIVSLTAREHFICHWLLTKIFTDDQKMVYAFNMMLVDKTGKRYRPISTTYAHLKTQAAAANTGSRGHRWITNGLENRMINRDDPIPDQYYPGRTFSAETKTKISEAAKNKKTTSETRHKMSVARRGKRGHPHTAETKRKISDARTGARASEVTKKK